MEKLHLNYFNRDDWLLVVYVGNAQGKSQHIDDQLQAILNDVTKTGFEIVAYHEMCDLGLDLITRNQKQIEKVRII